MAWIGFTYQRLHKNKIKLKLAYAIENHGDQTPGHPYTTGL